MKKSVWYIFICISAVAVLISGTYIGIVLYSRKVNTAYYGELQQELTEIFKNTDTDGNLPENTADSSNKNSSSSLDNSNGTQNGPRVNFAALLAQNSEVIGWIYSPGTKINYPVVKGTDNEYYLNRMLNGRKNAAGTLFADYQNNPDFSDYNTVIYGHNMNNKSMFGSLVSYKKQSYYNAHPYMYLFTPNGDYKLTLICGFVTESTSDLYLVPANPTLCKDVLNYGIEHSTFTSEVSVEPTDKLVTLSTCSYETKTSRYAVICKLENF